MPIESLPYEKIQSLLLEKMQARGCSVITITGCRYVSSSIFQMMKGHGYQSYCKEGGDMALKEYLAQKSANQYYLNLKTAVCQMNDLLDDNWKDRHGSGPKKYPLCEWQLSAITAYCSYCESAGRKAGTIRIKRTAASWFFHELNKMGCTNIDNISIDLVARACVMVTNHNLWGEISRFLRYLSDEGLLQADYSTVVPHYQKPYVIPSVYTETEVSQIELSISRESVAGKRDYAMVLLASRMGLRSGDIVNLRIDDIDFDHCSIDIIQQKTGTWHHLPLIEAVGNAIQEYLAVRPVAGEKQIFLSSYAPYKPITTGALRYAMRKYLSEAEIKPEHRRRGPHALRSSLASSMVNDSIPYETVRRILGHSSDNAIKHYARIDIERLRPYCLVPPNPTGSFRKFLGMGTEG